MASSRSRSRPLRVSDPKSGLARVVYGGETLSRRQFVLVDDTAETIAAQNTSIIAS